MSSLLPLLFSEQLTDWAAMWGLVTGVKNHNAWVKNNATHTFHHLQCCKQKEDKVVVEQPSEGVSTLHKQWRKGIGLLVFYCIVI